MTTSINKRNAVMNNVNIPVIDVLDQLPCHIYWVNKDKVLLGCNGLQAKQLGYLTPQKVIGKRLDDLILEPYLSVVLANNAKVLNSDKGQVFEEFSSPDTIWLSHKVPLKNNSGEVIGLLGVSQEISLTNTSTNNQQNLTEQTEKKAYLNQIKGLSESIIGYDHTTCHSMLDYFIEVRNHYERIISLMPGHIYWVNKEGLILGCNNTQAKSFGFNSTRDIIGKSCYDLLPKQEADAIINVNNKVMQENQSIFAEEDLTMLNSELRTYFSSKTPLMNNKGDVMGVLGISLDISDRKKIEKDLIIARKKAEAANQAKTEFLMNMSHDLRTPCSGILGFAEILYDEETNLEKREKLDCVVQSSRHLLNLLNEIIQFTKLDTDDFEPKHELLELPVLINNILELMLAKIKQKNLEIKYEYSPHLPSHFFGDPMLLHRIIFNLFSNAVKFTEEGYICLKLQPSASQKINQIEIIISDTGIGIAPQHFERIFDKFSRINPSYDGLYQGSGLGLNIVKKLTDKMGGTIKVSSEPNKGSTFHCTLPLKFADNMEISSQKTYPYIKDMPAAPLLELSSKQARHALIVEDDLVSQRITKHLLTDYNCKVTIAESAIQALAEDLSKFDFIIMDIGLPDTDGFTLTKKIREWERLNMSTNPLIIIGLTAHINDKDKLSRSQQGMDLLLNKPLTKEIIESL